MGFKTELALKVGGKALAAAACIYIVHVTAPVGGINHGIAEVKQNWQKSPALQSVTDRYLAKKITREQWVVECHTTQAKQAWLNLSTQYPKHHKILSQKIKSTWPAAEAWA
uniref:Uncharacterized protein n=1 Tax=Pseudomonas phage RVTF4 TaxID=3236931 RepID=A0AB39CD62_9VIRU